jgi:hypothetical protein
MKIRTATAWFLVATNGFVEEPPPLEMNPTSFAGGEKESLRIVVGVRA